MTSLLRQRSFQNNLRYEFPTQGLRLIDIAASGSGNVISKSSTLTVVVIPQRNAIVCWQMFPSSPNSSGDDRTTERFQQIGEEHRIFIERSLPLGHDEESANVVQSLTKEDRARLHINTFLGEVYSLSKIGDTDGAGIKIFDFLDRVLIDGFYTICDEVLGRIDIEKLDTKLMRSFLSITLPAKTKLTFRWPLYQKIEKKLCDLRGTEKAARILGGLA